MRRGRTSDTPQNVRDEIYWFRHRPEARPALRGEISADVVVVGGGMMGLMCARALSAAGRRVVVLEADTCGGGASGRSSGFITPDSELEYHDLKEHFGAEEARRLWGFAQGGSELIRHAIAADRIACDAQPQDALYVASSEGAASTIQAEHLARTSAGLDTTLLDTRTIARALGGVKYYAGIRFGGTFGIDAHRCCIGLRDTLIAAGAGVFENSAVIRWSRDGVETPNGAVRARDVMVCGDRWLPTLGVARREVYHVQTFLAVTEPLERSDVQRMFPSGPLMVWDTDLIYHYFRLIGGDRLLVGGGTLPSTYAAREQHRPDAAARRLRRYLREHFPDLSLRFAAAWPGLIGITKDFAPVLGRAADAPNVHFAGGAAGLPWAAALGQYLAERVLHGRDDLDAVLSVERKFAIGAPVQSVIGRRAAFALAHGLMKLKG